MSFLVILCSWLTLIIDGFTMEEKLHQLVTLTITGTFYPPFTQSNKRILIKSRLNSILVKVVLLVILETGENSKLTEQNTTLNISRPQ